MVKFDLVSRGGVIIPTGLGHVDGCIAGSTWCRLSVAQIISIFSSLEPNSVFFLWDGTVERITYRSPPR